MIHITHKFPRLEWTPCSQPPDDCRRVVIWHRCRKWCRFFQIVVGWWNTEEWRQADSQSHLKFGQIYKPVCWRDIEVPK